MGFNARWFAQLDDRTLEGVGRFLESCERLGMWPSAVKHALLHLIPKAAGGRRPIGLVDGLCRLWELARRPVVREWRRQQRRPYDYGARGRKATDAVWLQALYDEAAEEDGEAAATVLLDLTKAFESVPLALVWERGLALGFPAGILRLSLEVCAFVRHLTLDGVCGEGVHSLSAILAGTSFATDLLYVVMMGPCDRLAEAWPRLNLSLVVDDLAAQVVGSREEVPGTIVGVTRMAVEDLTALGCMVSIGGTWAPGGKTIAVGTRGVQGSRLGVSFRRMGVAMRRRAKHLGVDYAPGRRARGSPPLGRRGGVLQAAPESIGCRSLRGIGEI